MSANRPLPSEHVRCRRAAARSLASIGLVLAVGADPALGDGTSAPTAPTVARLVFLGDTSFGENYQEGLAEAGGRNVLEELGYDHMLASFEAVLRGASLVVANLETPVTDLASSPLRGRKRYIHHADVEETPRHLAGYGIDLVSLANNHAMDYGPAGLADTTASLTRRGIATCGAGRDEVRAGQPYRHDLRLGDALVRIAVICAFEYSEVHDHDLGYPGVDQRSPQAALIGSGKATTKTVGSSRRSASTCTAMARICCKGWSGTGADGLLTGSATSCSARRVGTRCSELTRTAPSLSSCWRRGTAVASTRCCACTRSSRTTW